MRQTHCVGRYSRAPFASSFRQCQPQSINQANTCSFEMTYRSRGRSLLEAVLVSLVVECNDNKLLCHVACLEQTSPSPSPSIVLFTGCLLLCIPDWIYCRPVHWELFSGQASTRTSTTTKACETGCCQRQRHFGRNVCHRCELWCGILRSTITHCSSNISRSSGLDFDSSTAKLSRTIFPKAMLCGRVKICLFQRTIINSELTGGKSF